MVIFGTLKIFGMIFGEIQGWLVDWPEMKKKSELSNKSWFTLGVGYKTGTMVHNVLWEIQPSIWGDIDTEEKC